MQKIFEIEQGVPEIWGFKWSEMILLRETKTRKKYHCATECSKAVHHLCSCFKLIYNRAASKRTFQIDEKLTSFDPIAVKTTNYGNARQAH